MANSVVRIELYDATEADYLNLHKEMHSRGFRTDIMSSMGDWYKLPPGLFHIHRDSTATRDILFSARDAASTTQKRFGIVVTDGNIAFDGLPKVAPKNVEAAQ